MKKDYIQPSTKEVLVSMQQMICVSGEKQMTASDDVVTDVNELCSRKSSSIWDDGEED